MRVSEEEVERIAHLSRLKLSDDKAAMQANLENILAHFDKLNELDTTNVQPTAHILPVQNVLREDVVIPSMDREKLTANAPQREDGCYVVPKVVE
jgi:aspartyl-tRNA(Asn)/glutamyl-tRNA(Gln) amidotransferase subunit C